MSIDVDEALSGRVLLSLNYRVQDQVPKALEQIESAMMKLGVVVSRTKTPHQSS